MNSACAGLGGKRLGGNSWNLSRLLGHTLLLDLRFAGSAPEPLERFAPDGFAERSGAAPWLRIRSAPRSAPDDTDFPCKARSDPERL